MNNIPTQPRRRLFRRLEESLPPLTLTERDIAILALVRDYRFINTAQIHALVGGSQHNVTERLSRLFHHGYLDRPAHQRELRAEGYRIMVYALTPKIKQHGVPWYKQPAALGVVVLAAAVVLNIIFW